MIFTRSKRILSPNQENLYGEKYNHITKRTDWEYLIFDLQRVISQSPNGIVIIGNTSLDKQSEPLQFPLYTEFTKNATLKQKSYIKSQFTNDYFSKRFEDAKNKNPDISDCYYLIEEKDVFKKGMIGFLIEHQTDPLKKAIAVYIGERNKKHFEKNLSLLEKTL